MAIQVLPQCGGEGPQGEGVKIPDNTNSGDKDSPAVPAPLRRRGTCRPTLGEN